MYTITSNPVYRPLAPGHCSELPAVILSHPIPVMNVTLTLTTRGSIEFILSQPLPMMNVTLTLNTSSKKHFQPQIDLQSKSGNWISRQNLIHWKYNLEIYCAGISLCMCRALTGLGNGLGIWATHYYPGWAEPFLHADNKTAWIFSRELFLKMQIMTMCQHS